MAIRPGKRLTMENHHVFHGKIHGLRTWTRCDLPGLPGYTDPKNGLQRMDPRNGETHIISKHL